MRLKNEPAIKIWRVLHHFEPSLDALSLRSDVISSTKILSHQGLLAMRDVTLFLARIPAPYTLHPTPYTPHPTPYTLHHTPYTRSFSRGFRPTGCGVQGVGCIIMRGRGKESGYIYIYTSESTLSSGRDSLSRADSCQPPPRRGQGFGFRVDWFRV